MPEGPAISTAFDDALETENYERVEELWLEELNRKRIRVDELLEVRRRLWKAGRKNLALTMLELLVETLEGAGDPQQSLAALREMVRLTTKPGRELVRRLEKALAESRADNPSLDAVVNRYSLTEQRKPAETLADMENWLNHDQGTIVEVVGQGVGRVIELNPSSTTSRWISEGGAPYRFHSVRSPNFSVPSRRATFADARWKTPKRSPLL